MNYDQAITEMLAAIKADKSLAQPWKNYASSDLARVQAVIRMAQTATNLKPPEGYGTVVSGSAEGTSVLRDDRGYSLACTCMTGAIDVSCPVHHL